MYEDIDITARAHPRLGVVIPYKCALQRNIRDLGFIKHLFQPVQLVVHLAVTVEGYHYLIFKPIFDLSVSDKVVFYQRITDDMGKVV